MWTPQGCCDGTGLPVRSFACCSATGRVPLPDSHSREVWPLSEPGAPGSAAAVARRAGTEGEFAVRRRIVAVVVAVAVGAAGCTGAAGDRAAPAVGSMIVDAATIAALPITGPPWAAVLRAAEEDVGNPDLEDQDNANAAHTLAAALVFVRTGEARFREAALAHLARLPLLPLRDARVLSVGRQIAGYVVAADLLGYREQGFVEFVNRIRTAELGGHDRWRSLAQASEDTASNWGAWALTSRIAASIFIGDRADIEAAAAVYRRFTGEPGGFAPWRETEDFDPTWACDPVNWAGINPADCGDRGGAVVEDISRSDGRYPEIDDTGLMYSWESLGAATLSARLLARAGYPDVYEWGDRALLRAAEFLHGHGGYPPEFVASNHVAWAINRAYGVELGPIGPAAHGRQFGFTDWLP
jgi:hypothetical protein